MKDTRVEARAAALPDGYTGASVAGEPHGAGRQVYRSGECYDGQWERGLWHGVGTFVYADGQVWTGDWQHGERHGFGKLVRPDGMAIDGRWENGRVDSSSFGQPLPPQELVRLEPAFGKAAQLKEHPRAAPPLARGGAPDDGGPPWQQAGASVAQPM